MPAQSKAQQAAAGIALSAARGEQPKSSLKGASKQMFKGMGKTSLGHFAKTKTSGLPQHKAEESSRDLFMRARLQEGRDDTAKLPLGKAGQAYAHVSSKDVMSQPGGTAAKVQKRYNLQKEVTNQQHVGNSKGSKIFPSMDKVGKVPSAIKDSAAPEQVVRAMLDED